MELPGCEGRRRYTIRHDGQEVFRWFESASMAMNGGLDADHEDETVSVFVSNPIANTFDKIASCAILFHCWDFCSDEHACRQHWP